MSRTKKLLVKYENKWYEVIKLSFDEKTGKKKIIFVKIKYDNGKPCVLIETTLDEVSKIKFKNVKENK